MVITQRVTAPELLQDALDSLEHTLRLNLVEEVGDHVSEARNLIEIAMLSPDEILGGEDTLSNLTRIVGSPKLLKKIHDLRVVVGDNLDTVLALATLIVGDDGSETEDETLRQLTLTLEISLEARKVTCLELRERVEHNARHLMVDKRVVETLEDVGSKLLKLLHREIEGLHKLIELHLMDVFADDRVVASVADDIDAAEECDRREDGVRAIEESYLTLVVRLLALSDEDMETSLLCGELLAKILNAHVLRLLDDPEVENLSLDDEVVRIANRLLNLSDVLTGEARDNAIDERRTDVAIICEPSLERLIVSAEVTLPKLDVLEDAILKMMTVEEDELARHDD